MAPTLKRPDATTSRPAPAPDNTQPRALAKVLGELSVRNQKLNELDSQLSELIVRIEQGLSTHFSVRLERSIGNDGEALVFGKLDGQWRLFVGNERFDSVTPLTSASRETRARMFSDGHAEALFRDAVASLDHQIVARGAAVANAAALAAAFDDLDIPF